MTEQEAREMADLIVRVARALIDEGKTIEDVKYCKQYPQGICFCDDCGALMNLQEGYEDAEDMFVFRKCGYVQKFEEVKAS